MKQKIKDLVSRLTAPLRYLHAVFQMYSPAVQHTIIIGSLLVLIAGSGYAGHQTGVSSSVLEFIAETFFQADYEPKNGEPVGTEVVVVDGQTENTSGGEAGPQGSGSTGSQPGSSGGGGSTARSGSGSRTGGGSSGGGGLGNLETTPLELFSSQCLPRNGNTVAISGARNVRYFGTVTPNTKFNASTASWNGVDANGNPIAWVVIVQGPGPACWYGGRYQGVWNDTSPDVTWENPYHHSGAMTIRTNDFLVEGYRADNQGDGIRMEGSGANFHMRGNYMSNIHDDCVENDFLHGGTTEDNLFDGCYSGFSGDDHTGTLNGSGNTWTFRNNLMRMKPYPTVHRVGYFTERGCSLPNHMHAFKGWWNTNTGPKVVFKNNIIKFDIKPCDSVSFFPKGVNLAECSNNIIVYTGPGNFNQAVPPCVTVTKDVNVWNNAVSRWKQAHPNVR